MILPLFLTVIHPHHWQHISGGDYPTLGNVSTEDWVIAKQTEQISKSVVQETLSIPFFSTSGHF